MFLYYYLSYTVKFIENRNVVCCPRIWNSARHTESTQYMFVVNTHGQINGKVRRKAQVCVAQVWFLGLLSLFLLERNSSLLPGQQVISRPRGLLLSLHPGVRTVGT